MSKQRLLVHVCRTAAGGARQLRPSIALIVLGGSLFACGSRTMVDPASDGDPVDDFRGGGGADSGGSGGRAPGPDAPRPPGDVDGVLPACEPGFQRSNAGGRDCTYTFGASCYEDENVACACACRGLSDSNCIIDGFLDADAPQQVRCVAR